MLTSEQLAIVERYERAIEMPAPTTPAGLNHHRKAHGFTQSEMGCHLGLSAKHIGMMERGQASIERRTALAVLSMTISGV